MILRGVGGPLPGARGIEGCHLPVRRASRRAGVGIVAGVPLGDAHRLREVILPAEVADQLLVAVGLGSRSGAHQADLMKRAHFLQQAGFHHPIHALVDAPVELLAVAHQTGSGSPGRAAGPPGSCAWSSLIRCPVTWYLQGAVFDPFQVMRRGFAALSGSISGEHCVQVGPAMLRGERLHPLHETRVTWRALEETRSERLM